MDLNSRFYLLIFIEGESFMAKQVSPFHSKGGEVYHIYGVCSSGSAITKKNRVAGKGNKKLCKACVDIRAGKRTH